MNIAIVVPHLFMQEKYLRESIFAPGHLARDLANELSAMGNNVTLFSPGKVAKLSKPVTNITAELNALNVELKSSKLKLNELITRKPLTYITLYRQIQSELIAKAYAMANSNKFDIVHVFITEEEISYAFASLCTKPVVFTHHEPFNLLVKYRASFRKYCQNSWISISYSQRKTAPKNFNWAGNVYNGLPEIHIKRKTDKNYFAYLGRIIEEKGVHLAIKAVKKYNETASKKVRLILAGKYYSDNNDSYWVKKIKPYIDNSEIVYKGFLSNPVKKSRFLQKAKALIVPSIWNEPFGMVVIEALRSGTPVLGLKSGALPEIINKKTGILVRNFKNENKTVEKLAQNLEKVSKLSSKECVSHFKNNFTVNHMANGYLKIYRNFLGNK